MATYRNDFDATYKTAKCAEWKLIGVSDNFYKPDHFNCQSVLNRSFWRIWRIRWRKWKNPKHCDLHLITKYLYSSKARPDCPSIEITNAELSMARYLWLRFILEIGKMDENDRLNPQKNEAYFQTLSRSQQISFTRRIRFEYEVSLW